MFSSSEKLKSEHFSSILFSGVIWQKVMRCHSKSVMRNAQKKKENLGEREPLVFFISLVSRTVTKVVVLFIRNLHLNTHTNYVCKTYGRDSRSQEIGTSRESRDRCHLLRARIRHADVDQFVYQRQRLIFKGIKIFLSSLLVLLLGAFLSLFSSSFILLRLQIERNGFAHLDAASTCVYASCLLLR